MYRIILVILIALAIVSCGNRQEAEEQKGSDHDQVTTGDVQKNTTVEEETTGFSSPDGSKTPDIGIVAKKEADTNAEETPPNLDIDKVAKIFFERGVKEYNQKRYERSMQEFIKVTNIKPQHSKAFYNIGMCKFQMKDYFGALEEFKTSADLNPKDSVAVLYIGLSKHYMNDIPGAIQSYNKSLEIGPFFPEEYYNRGTARANQKDYAGALEDFNLALKYKPRYPEALTNRGNTYFSMGNRDAACEDWKQAKKLGVRTLNKFIEDYCD